jgi:hypothetical protein
VLREHTERLILILAFHQNFSSAMANSLDSILAQAKESVARREGGGTQKQQQQQQQHQELLRQKDEELARLRGLLAERNQPFAPSAHSSMTTTTGTFLSSIVRPCLS